MSISLRIDEEIKRAMKNKNVDVLSTLRMLKAAATHEAILKKKNNLEDSEILDVIQKQVKQRKESIESFKTAGRTELAEKEMRELEVLQSYLPKQLSESEIKALIVKAIETTGAKSKADLGKVMKAVTPETKGRADGKLVTELVQSLLQ